VDRHSGEPGLALEHDPGVGARDDIASELASFVAVPHDLAAGLVEGSEPRFAVADVPPVLAVQGRFLVWSFVQGVASAEKSDGEAVRDETRPAITE
jgi:hypothetical protein